MEIPVEISDSPVTGLKRKAHITGFHWESNPGFFLTKVTIHFFENLGGEYGEEIVERGIYPYNEELYANNTVMINPENFAVVVIDEETEQYPEGSIGEFDAYFNLLLEETQPIPNRTLMVNSVLLADSRGRFN